NYNTYMKHSALFHLENIDTPLQILHGENDNRVPVSQSKELYVALKRKGIPTELVLYPRSGHIPSEPKLLMDVTPRMLKWFEKFSQSVIKE
ncbi:MAG TPA: prolyl oligopeptidase family serine peptidase, partial [Bacteroidales bacterium]|nr:prolyl oligopeptidase family serine peptidase [Bacteroidales bacterium]